VCMTLAGCDPAAYVLMAKPDSVGQVEIKDATHVSKDDIEVRGIGYCLAELYGQHMPISLSVSPTDAPAL